MLSIAILAKDEEQHISDCLRSVAHLAAEIIVLLDNRSSDQTENICNQHKAVVYVEPWRGYAGQRNRAIQLCRGDWVLFLDADERVTSQLAQELRSFTSNNEFDGYWIPRKNIFFGQILRGGGWYPDYQLRLLRREQTSYDENQHVHEVAQLRGKAGRLTGHILHYNIDRLAEFWQKQTKYALEEARILWKQRKQTRWRNFVGAPAREFWRRYKTLAGWRDGFLGLFLCGALAWFEIVKYACLYLLQTPSKPKRNLILLAHLRSSLKDSKKVSKLS